MRTTRREVLAIGIGSLVGPLPAAKRVVGRSAGSSLDGGKFSAHTTEAGEIVTETTVEGRLVCRTPTAAYPRRRGERWEEPLLIVGPDQAPWLFYRSSVRRFVYYHRWLGDDWGPRHDGRGFYFVDPDHTNSFSENYLPIRRFDVRSSAPRAVEIKVYSEVWGVPEGRTERICLPNPAAFAEQGTLFLDTSYVAEARGLVRTCELPKKHPANPVFTPGGHPSMPDHMGVMNHGTVLRDEKGRFRMWYSGYEQVGQGPTPTGQNWTEYMHVCYAESDDGVHWRRPELGLLSFAGSTKNNLLPLYLTPVVVEDKGDPDPLRRFKAAQQVGFESQVHPMRSHLQVSPDGIHWRTLVGRRVFPGTRPWWFEFTSSLRDAAEPDPAKRWKAYGYFATSPSRRTCGLATSPDCLTWTGYPENPVIDPLQGKKEQAHDLIVWKEQGLYVGLVQVADRHEHYEYELVFSHDGIHFSRVQDGLEFLSLGGPNDWDCELMTASSAPVLVGDEIWFYYGAKQRPKQPAAQGDLYSWSRSTTSAGLATMKRGRYAGFKARSQSDRGVLRTVPFAAKGSRAGLRVNAACTTRDALRVAVVDAETGGFLLPFGECEPIVRDGVALPVTWRKPLPATSRGRISLLFELTGKACLYGIDFGE